MAYRRTDRVIARLAARHDAIIAAARALAGESGMAAVQIVPVAHRAGIAAGTVYRYFPSKEDLVGALLGAAAEQEIAAVRRAAAAAPGPLSALAGAIMAFAARVLRERRLAWALFAEPIDDASADAGRLAFRRTLAAEFATCVRVAIEAGHLPDQDPAFAAVAVIGAVLEGLVGPLASAPAGPDTERSAARALALFALRGLGVVDARARGLVVQTGWPVQPG
jgi:AcrR family transcriptional regulator